MATETFAHPPDTLVTVFMDNEVHQSVVTLWDLRRMYSQVQHPSGIATIGEPTSVIICWRPFTGTEVDWPKIGG